MDAKGRTPAKSGRLASADSMLCLEMWSCAPTPSTLRMVVWASLSVAARTTRTSASAPALVLSANWNGAHARWDSVLSCCASVRATRRRNASPITSARTSPDGFERATILPRRRAGRIAPGTCAIASLRAAPRRSSAQCSSSRRTRRCSPVQLDGPGAAPFLERQTLAMRRTELSSIVPNRPKPNSGLMGIWGSGGRRTGSRSCLRVSWFVGASGRAVSALAAAGSSPRWASAAARSARRRRSASASPSVRCCHPSCAAEGAVAAAPAASCNSSRQCPPWKARSRRRSSSGGTRCSPGERYRSILGASRKSFHPSQASSDDGASRMVSSPTRNALRRSPLSWRGGDCKV